VPTVNLALPSPSTSLTASPPTASLAPPAPSALETSQHIAAPTVDLGLPRSSTWAKFPIAVWTDGVNLVSPIDQVHLDALVENESFRSLAEYSLQFTELKCIATSAADVKRVPRGYLVKPEAISSAYLKNPNKRAGAWLEYLEQTVEMLLGKIPVGDIFKIGYAKNPRWRFQRYQKENMGYETMYLVAVDMNVEIVQLLEAMLIRLFNGIPGCQNRVAGGEGPPANRDTEDVPVFLYLVVGTGPFGPGQKRQRT